MTKIEKKTQANPGIFCHSISFFDCNFAFRMGVDLQQAQFIAFLCRKGGAKLSDNTSHQTGNSRPEGSSRQGARPGCGLAEWEYLLDRH